MLAIYLKHNDGRWYDRVQSCKFPDGISCKTELCVNQDAFKFLLGRSFYDAFEVLNEGHLQRLMTQGDLDKTIEFLKKMIEDAKVILERHNELDMSDAVGMEEKPRAYLDYVEELIRELNESDGWQSYIDEIEIAIEFCQYAKEQISSICPTVMIEFVP